VSEGRDSWPGDCSACEAGRCEYCTGVTIEGIPCECGDEGHFGNVDYDDDYDDYEDEVTA
jgi:hypothetical protein